MLEIVSTHGKKCCAHYIIPYTGYRFLLFLYIDKCQTKLLHTHTQLKAPKSRCIIKNIGYHLQTTILKKKKLHVIVIIILFLTEK